MKVAHFSKVYYHRKLQNTILNNAIVITIPQIHMPLALSRATRKVPELFGWLLKCL
jgi:hypothetical protein